MNIALIGYGKMGKTLEAISISRGHSIVAIIDPSTGYSLEKLKKAKPNVVIEFTQPESALENILYCIREGIPVISGTTGWLDHWNIVETAVKEFDGTFFYASNFSIGVNLFFKLNSFLAKLMAGQNQYKVCMEEIHHTEKKDSPSGTALTLTKPILKNRPELIGWKETAMSEDNYLNIDSRREGNVPGTHIIHYKSSQDQITIAHEAFSREGFGFGAVLVAEWISGKKGLFSMENFLSM